MKIVLINGPSRVGKDTVQSFIPGHCEKLSWPLKYGVMGMFEPACATRMNYYEEHKDEPFREFRGLPLSYRQAQIDLYEQMKDVYGGQWLGDLLVDRLKGAATHIENNYGGLVSVSDSGRREECEPIVKAFGAANCLVFRVVRPGVEWTDNRQPIDLTDMGVPFCWVNNAGTKEMLKTGTEALLKGLNFWTK